MQGPKTMRQTNGLRLVSAMIALAVSVSLTACSDGNQQTSGTDPQERSTEATDPDNRQDDPVASNASEEPVDHLDHPDLKLDRAVASDPSLPSFSTRPPDTGRSTVPPSGGGDTLETLRRDVEALKAAVSRATVIVIGDFEFAHATSRAGATVRISGGNLETPLSCESNPFGACVFLLSPLAEGQKSYKVRIEAQDYTPVEQEFRVSAGMLGWIPVKVSLKDSVRDALLRPPVIEEEIRATRERNRLLDQEERRRIHERSR